MSEVFDPPISLSVEPESGAGWVTIPVSDFAHVVIGWMPGNERVVLGVRNGELHAAVTLPPLVLERVVEALAAAAPAPYVFTPERQVVETSKRVVDDLAAQETDPDAALGRELAAHAAHADRALASMEAAARRAEARRGGEVR